MDDWVGCGEAVMVVGGDVEPVVGKVCNHIYVALIRWLVASMAKVLISIKSIIQ